MSRPARGYSLVELLVVLAVLGVLAMVAMPLAELSARREKERELRQALWQIREALDAYHRAAVSGAVRVSESGAAYPANLHVLVQGVDDARNGRRLVFLRRIPRDPFADAALPAHATWALRSYASPYDEPQAGEDVYDVSSRSMRIGLNGVPLREW